MACEGFGFDRKRSNPNPPFMPENEGLCRFKASVIAEGMLFRNFLFGITYPIGRLHFPFQQGPSRASSPLASQTLSGIASSKWLCRQT